eukprot:1086558_1
MISRYSLVRVTILLALLSRFTISKDSDTHNNKLVSGYIKQTCGTKNTVYKDIEHLLETFYLDPSRQTTEDNSESSNKQPHIRNTGRRHGYVLPEYQLFWDHR